MDNLQSAHFDFRHPLHLKEEILQLTTDNKVLSALKLRLVSSNVSC